MDYKLTIELVPRTIWYRNLRSILPARQWDKLRKETYKRVGYKCEICGGKGDKWPVECHEKWHYDDQTHTATLVGLFGLCPSCHECKHAGLASVRGRTNQVLEHLSKVNGISKHEAGIQVRDAFNLFEARSMHEWTVDISIVDELSS